MANETRNFGIDKDISAETMLNYLQSMLDYFTKYVYDGEAEELDSYQSNFITKMCACKDMVETLIGEPVNLGKDGKVSLGF